MLSPQKSGLLQAFLGTLPNHLAARLAKAVEIDRLSDGASLPHDLILEGLRPVLRRGVERERTPTPLRLFCRPFEDLLTSTPRLKKQKGRIARSTVTPVWLWVSGTLIPDSANAFVAAIKSYMIAFKVDEAKSRAIDFWSEASAAMREALSTEAGRKLARAALNGDAPLADAEEIALLLAVGADILDMQEQLPKPVPSFNDDLLWQMRAIYDRLVQTMPDAAPYVAVVAMNRLDRPWEALRLPLSIARKSEDTLIASTDMGLVGEIVFADIDALSMAVRATRHPDFDADALIENVASFAELSSAVVKEIQVRRDGKWGQGLLKDRAAVGNVMDEFMERAPVEIANALPMRRSGTFSTTRLPDFSRKPDPQKIERGLRYARLISGCKLFAAAASFGASLKKAQDEAADHLLRYNDEVVKELRTAEGPHHDIAQEQLALATQLTSLLFGEQEADLLRRRGRAAVAAAA